MFRSAILASLSIGFLTSCSIHPLPAVSGGRYTLNIVQSIRCEARDGFRFFLLDHFRDKDYPYYNHPYTVEARQFLQSEDGLLDLDRKILHPEAQQVLAQFDRAAIVYDFRFLITEQNNNKLSTIITDPLSSGFLNIELKGAANLARENQRSFRVVDQFSEFYEIDIARRCNKPGLADGRKSENFLFPIEGRIGLREVIWNYFLLVQTVGLANQDKSGKASTPAFIERLKFTTTFSGDINPEITLNPLMTKPYFAKVTGGFGAVRIDEHEVSVALSLNPASGVAGTNASISELERQQTLDALGARRGF